MANITMNLVPLFVFFIGYVFYAFVECQIAGYTAGVDYPIYNEIPKGLSFTCSDKGPGYYSDPEAQCQVWHWCLPNGRKYSFLCPNGTVFNQIHRVCDWWFNVDCPSVTSLYSVNLDLYKDAAGNAI
ncbi:U-scoloptoxin(01)-Cw1a [Chrysoperla carnea]|uniref:U-scoloptoxin(01)-Cw1a n=1 Tax=Chrysoperla carnea TaxID=189513 RepID=UPI001D087796|nr:U-scoloptoxin(01)-Cw1a [Chrysoperla carnea]